MEFKGTKGKWVISEVGKPNENNDNTGKHTVTVENNSNYGFVDVWFSNGFQCDNDKEALYNALLISKAPEMLEMLKDIVEQENVSQSAHDAIYDLIKEATEL